MAYPGRVDLPHARLERWDAARHLAVLEAMRGDPDVTAFLDFLLIEDLAEVAAHHAAHWEAHGFGLWAVSSHDGDPVGWIGAVHPRWHPDYADKVELAWGLCRPAWGAGTATRGARAAAAACFDVLGLHEVMAFFDPENDRSIRVGQRLGMQPAGETTRPRSGHRMLTYALTPARFAEHSPPAAPSARS